MKAKISRERLDELIKKVNNDESLTEQDIKDLVIERKQRLEFRKKLKEAYDKNIEYIYKNGKVVRTIVKNEELSKRIYYKISDNEKMIDAIELYLIQSGNGAAW